MTDYTYSITNDIISQQVDTDQLQYTILNDVVLNINYSGMNVDGDTLTIHYTSALDPSAETHLDDVVANHTPIAVEEYSKDSPVPLNIQSITAVNDYTKVASYIYQGVINDYLPTKVLFYLIPQGTISSVSLKVIDITNSKTITESTGLSLTGDGLYALTDISNLPLANAIFQIYVRKDDGDAGDELFVELVNLYFA